MMIAFLVVGTLTVGQVGRDLPAPTTGGTGSPVVVSFGLPTIAQPDDADSVQSPPATARIPLLQDALRPPGLSLVQQGPATGAGSGRGAGAGKEAGAGDSDSKNGDGNGKKDSDKKKHEWKHKGPLAAFIKAYYDEFYPDPDQKAKSDKDDEQPTPPPRRANPAPLIGFPLPASEWQGYPNIGIPRTDFGSYPLMKALYATPWGDAIKDSQIYVYGWITGSGNYSTSHNSNVPAAYAVVPNRAELDQAVLRIEREPDTVQTDQWDWGFRLTGFYGIDYRYTTAGGWGSEQLLKHNRLYGFDPLEDYFELYIPRIFDGVNIRIGRYISPPDIEAQLAPDNYLASHSLLFTYDNYTQTGILGTVKMNNQWMWQVGLNAGGDMAPWYQGATPTGFLGLRWISQDNKDSIYTCWNDINNAQYRSFMENGQLTGHDNYNYVVSTWSHAFTNKFITTTEAYYMYEYNAPLGGTPSTGPVQSFGGGGGIGPILPGLSTAYGVLNYTAFAISDHDYVTVRNEAWDDPRGMRTGFASWYTSHTIGLAHYFNAYLQIRPELGFYRSYNEPAFDLGTRKNMLMFLCDMTIRF